MIDVNQTLINYGYLQREIGDVLAYACAGTDESITMLKIDNAELSTIMNKIREMKAWIKELEDQLREGKTIIPITPPSDDGIMEVDFENQDEDGNFF